MIVLVAVLIAVLTAVDCGAGWTLLKDVQEHWRTDSGLAITFITLLVALSVWWGEIVQEWRDHLPKRLSVEFLYGTDNGQDRAMRTVMSCSKANLADVADIRALGQQIGSQLVDPDLPDRSLGFRAPYVLQDNGKIEYQEGAGFYQHYRVRFTLTKLPDKLDPNRCKVWVEPFDKDDISITEGI